MVFDNNDNPARAGNYDSISTLFPNSPFDLN